MNSTDQKAFEFLISLHTARVLKDVLESENIQKIMEKDVLIALNTAQKTIKEKYGDGPKQNLSFFLTIAKFLQAKICTYATTQTLESIMSLKKPFLPLKEIPELILQTGESVCNILRGGMNADFEAFILESFNSKDTLEKLQKTFSGESNANQG